MALSDIFRKGEQVIDEAVFHDNGSDARTQVTAVARRSGYRIVVDQWKATGDTANHVTLLKNATEIDEAWFQANGGHADGEGWLHVLEEGQDLNYTVETAAEWALMIWYHFEKVFGSD